MSGVRIAVLGPLRVWRGERELEAGPAQQQAVLAALALRSGQVASADDLVRDVWGADPPASASVALRNHVSRLRAALESDSSYPRTLLSLAGGYALRLDGGALDVAEAERLSAQAQSATARGAIQSAAESLGQALRLWSGTPLTGVPGEYAQRQRTRLTEYRLALVEARLELELRLGRHHLVATELVGLVDEHPLREGLRALQMLALYRCGRQADALAGFAEARRVLAEELGVDPGPELVRQHQRILEADPTLLPPRESTPLSPAPDAPAEAAYPVWVPAAQIPPDIPDFTGRAQEAAQVASSLTGAVRAQATAPVICVIHGMGGVGKTTLAVHAAHTVREDFHDGQLYADLRGAGGDPADPHEVQEWFLRVLGVAARNIPEGRAERTALYRSRLAGRRVLIVLDNAADTEQVSPLLPSTSGCAALVTSRRSLACLPTTSRTLLEPFSEEEALALLERIAGTDRCRRERQTGRALVRSCGLLPLAVRVVAARLAARPRWALSALAARISDRARRLTELEAGSLAVQSVFEVGYSVLDADQARAFRLLAIPEAADLSSAAAAAVLGCDQHAAEAVLDSLAHVGLLEAGKPGRYRYHDLLRLFARHKTLDMDPEAVRQAALSGMARFYMYGVGAVMRVEWPHSRLPGLITPQVAPCCPDFTDENDAQRWLLDELPAMLAVANQILDHPYRPVSVEDTRALAGLLVLLMPYTDLCLPWQSLDALAHKVLEAAERQGEQTAAVFGGVVAAIARAHGGRHEDARTLARRAYEVPRPAEPPLTHRLVHVMGLVAALRPGGLEEAIDHYRRAHSLSCAAGDPGIAAQCSLGMAQAHLELAQPDHALEAAGDAVAQCRTAGTPAGIVLALRSRGEALSALGRHDEAVAEYHTALDICRDHRLHTQRARTLLSYASALADAGHQQADTFAAQARTALAQLGDAAGERQAHALLNRLATAAQPRDGA